MKLRVGAEQFYQNEFYDDKAKYVESIEDIRDNEKNKSLLQVGSRDRGFDAVEMSIAVEEAKLTGEEKLLIGLLAYGFTHKEIMKQMNIRIKKFRILREKAVKKLRVVM